MKNKIFHIIFFFLCLTLPHLADAEISLIKNDEKLYKIQNIFYNSQNAFQEKTLLKKIPIDRNRTFREEELLDYIAKLEKQFLDTRLIDTVKIDYAIAEKKKNTNTAESDNTNLILIDFFIQTQKSGNFIIFPYPKYDSNTGFSLKAKLKDYNAFKRMEIFSSDLSYTLTPEKTTALESEIDFIFPFYIGYTNNKIYSDVDLFYDIDKAFFQSDSKLGIEFSFPIEKFSLNIFFEEEYIVKDAAYLNQALGIFFPFLFGDKIQFTIKPGFMYLYSLALEGSHTSSSYLIPTFDIESKKISYTGNFRNGYEVSGETNFDFHLEEKHFNPNLLLQAQLFTPILKKDEPFFLHSTRLIYYYNQERDIPMGLFIRGILDTELKAKQALVINNDFTFKLFNTCFNTKHSSKFNFELQTSLFFDTSFVFTPEYIFDQTMGLNLIVQPESMKSVQGRISVAGNFDWTNPKKDRKSGIEIYIGIGLFY